MEMFDEREFEQLRFNVYPVALSEDLFEKFPSMRTFSSFKDYEGKEGYDRLIRYVIYMYDVNSPMGKNIANLDERKKACAFLSGFTSEDDEYLEDLYTLEDKEAAEMVVEFLKEHDSSNHLKWCQIVTNEHTFYEYQKALLSETLNIEDEKKRLDATLVKSKLMEDSQVIAERIDTLYQQVFTDPSTFTAAKRKRVTPETMARNV